MHKSWWPAQPLRPPGMLRSEEAIAPSPLRVEGCGVRGDRSTGSANDLAKDEVHVLTSTRILARRRLGTAGATPHVTPQPRRRRRTRGFVQRAGAAAAERLRVDMFGYAYVAAGWAVCALP